MSDHSNALKLAAGTLAIYIAAQTVGQRLLYYLAYVLAAVLVAAYLWSQLNRRGITVRRRLEPANAQVGQTVEEIVHIENRFPLPKLWLEVRDRSTIPGHHVGAVVSLGGGKSKRWRVRTRCVHRGLFHAGPTVLSTGDPFGLFRVRRIFPETSELLVYPPTVPLAAFGIPEGELPGGLITEKRSHHTTPNAAGIRDYFPGDPLNRIHWPVSARAQKLMVKEFELDPTADIWLLLDLQEDVHVACPPEVQRTADAYIDATLSRLPGLSGPYAQPKAGEAETFRLKLDPSTEEYSVTVAASVAAHLLSEGRSVGFIAWGQHRVVLAADRGGRQLVKILRALAVLRAEGTAGLGELITAESRQFARQDTLVVVTPSLDEAWLAALQGQQQRGIRATAVVVEPATFCASGNSLMLVSALTSLNVPTYVVKRDDKIDAALAQHYNAMGVRNLR